MKSLLAVFLTASFFLTSCCSYISKEKNDNSMQTQQPSQIKINQSKIMAEVESINFTEEYDFEVRAKVLEIEDDAAYESLAIQGNVYNMKPNFVILNGKVNKNSERNNRLKSLSNLNKGDKFNAIIFSEGLKGWFIKDIIK